MTKLQIQEKTRDIFRDMVVLKLPTQNKFFASLSIPSYLRDWLIMRFADENGKVNLEEAAEYAKKNIPSKKDWELLKSRLTKSGERVRFLAKVRAEVDVRTGEGLFSLPDLGFPSRRTEAVLRDSVLRRCREELLNDGETWGVIELEWDATGLHGREGDGAIFMTDFKPFQPYRVDLDFFQEARREFRIGEWIDVLLLAIDYNPAGFLDEKQKLALLSRILPFVEKRLNIIELAPKGTGKSYIFSQISKHGWLVSGGSMTRARLFWDQNKRTEGLFSRHDYVAFDEVQTISFPDVNEIRGALKGYLETGEYRVYDHHGIGEAGLVLMGNISEELMDTRKNMFQELPEAFQESALLDRFHGFICGWDIPRVREDMKANGWALNVEYISEIFHSLRSDILYRGVVEELLVVPKGADTRDTEAIKRIATAYLKLFFPHVRSAAEIDKEEFKFYCLDRALDMRGVIRRQLHIMDGEYRETLPQIDIS